MLRKARLLDIGLLTSVYSHVVGEWGFGPIPDLDAAITAAVSGKPLILPCPLIFGESAEFAIDATIAERPDGEFAGFYLTKAHLMDGKPTELPSPYGVATELWFVAVAPQQRRLGTGRHLVKDALNRIRSRTCGRGGMLAHVTGPNYAMSRILHSLGFAEVGWHFGVTTVWLHPKSDVEDDFADIVDRG